MMQIMGWIALVGVISGIEVPRLWRKKAIYDIWVFSVLLGISAVYGVLYSLDVPLPDPNALVKLVYDPIGKWLMQPAIS